MCLADSILMFPQESILTEMVRELAYSPISIHELNDGVMCAERVFVETKNRKAAIAAGMAIALRNVKGVA